MGVSVRKKTGNSSGGLLRFLAYAAVVCIIIGLCISCITLSVLLKGAKHAHHELWKQLNDQEKKTSDAYQEMASDKVVLVEQEEKARAASREERFCNSMLETTHDELEMVKSEVEILNRDISDAREREQTCLADVKEKVTNNQALSKELKTWMDKYDHLKKYTLTHMKKTGKTVSKTSNTKGSAAGIDGDELLYAAMYTNHVPKTKRAGVASKKKKSHVG